MIVTRLLPAPAQSIDLDVAASRAALEDLYRPHSPSSVRINLITSMSGALGGSDGTSHTLSNPVDRRILGVIRDLSDVVLVGAQSVRSEGYILPRRARLAVLTGTGDLSGHGIPRDVERGRVLVLAPATAAERVARSLDGADAEIATIPDVDGRLALDAVITALQMRGLEQIVCEGGPRLAAGLLDAGRVDEVCLTTSPVLNGSSLPSLASVLGTERPARLEHLLADESGAIYARWRIARDRITTEPATT